MRASVNTEEKSKEVDVKWGKVSAVLFDMDGVLCNSEEASRLAAVDLFDEMGVKVTVEDFIPFMGTGTGFFFFINLHKLLLDWLFILIEPHFV